MTPSLLEKKVHTFKSTVGSGRRIGVSELARSKEWRDELGSEGCLEVVDRTETVGYVMDASYADALVSYIDSLEHELEQAHIRELFALRRQASQPLSGAELTAAALAELDRHEPAIREFLDGDR